MRNGEKKGRRQKNGIGREMLSSHVVFLRCTCTQFCAEKSFGSRWCLAAAAACTLPPPNLHLRFARFVRFRLAYKYYECFRNGVTSIRCEEARAAAGALSTRRSEELRKITETKSYCRQKCTRTTKFRHINTVSLFDIVFGPRMR